MITSEQSVENAQKIKVLIADDDPPTRILLKAAISQWGYEVIEASNGEEAWETLSQASPPQLLILDWLMPKLDGISLCARIKKEHIPHTYTILLTQVTGTTNIIKGLEAGADEFLSKPFNMAELRSRLSVGARIIKFENALAEQNKAANEYAAIMDALKQTLNTHDPEKASMMLNSILENEIKKFGGKLSVEAAHQGIRILIDLPYLQKKKSE
jgi:DNA-binding response OmpR family regulator